MPFFIKAKKNKINNAKKSKISKFKYSDEEISSGEEEDFGNKRAIETNDYESNSEDDNETPQDKKIRLAKLYLKEIEKAESRLNENKELDAACNGVRIEKVLKDDYLKQIGKYKENISDKYIKEVDINSITLLKCKQHKRSVTCLCISSDDEYIYSGSKDGCIVKWSIKNKRKESSIYFGNKGDGLPIVCIAISTDNVYLAIGSNSLNIKIIDPITLDHIHTFESSHKDFITGLIFKKDSHTLYSSSKDKSIKVWTLDEKCFVESVFGHLNAITSIDALNEDRLISSGGSDQTIRIWKIPEESQLIFEKTNGCSIDCVRYVNNQVFISGGDDGQLCLWNNGMKKVHTVISEAHGTDPSNEMPNWISSVAACVNTDLVASGSCNGEVKLWKANINLKPGLEYLFSIPVVGYINSMAFTNDGKYLIVGVGAEHRLGRWKVISGSKNSVVIIPLSRKD